MEILIGLIVVVAIIFGLTKLKKKFGKPRLTNPQKEYINKIASNPNSDRIIGIPAYGLVKKYGQTGVYGEKSEIATALTLATLTSKNKGLFVLNNVQFTSNWDIDHVVVAGNTIILIDTKNWKGKSRYALRNETKNGKAQTVALRDGQGFQGNSINMAFYVETVRSLYPRFNVVGVMNIDAFNAVMAGGDSYGFYFVKKQDLIKTINTILGNKTYDSVSNTTKVVVKSLANKTTQS